MKKNIIGIMFIIFVAIFINASEESGFLTIDWKTEIIDMKNFINKNELTTTYKGKTGNGWANVEQYYYNAEIPTGNNLYSFKTILVENSKATEDNYLVSADEDLMNKPVKIFLKDDYNNIIANLKSENDKKYFSSLYDEEGNYYILSFKKGTVKKEVILKIRDLLKTINYEYKYKLVWLVSYGNLKLVGKIASNTDANIKIGKTLVQGKITPVDMTVTFGTEKIFFDYYATKPYCTFDNNRIDLIYVIDSFKAMKSMTGKTILKGYEPKDEEMFLIMAYMWGLNIISRY